MLTIRSPTNQVITETFHGDEKFATSVQHSTDTPVVGVYARGSVARGEARAGVSDVDLVAVLWGHDTADGVRTVRFFQSLHGQLD
jgi:predicted nucleotidyltransferase